MYLYLYHSENRDRDELIRKALREYCGSQKIKLTDEELRDVVIEREGKGKPYIARLFTAGCPGRPVIHFSLSHSGSWWGCLMAAEPVGFDLEVYREKINYKKIAQRFFTKEECDFILVEGLDAFYDVWVRKEAYVKYLGSGLAEGLDSFSVTENGELSPKVISKKSEVQDRLPCFIRSCEIRDDVKAAYCSGSGDPIKATISLE